jgi:glycosyltransferase involved in cell wall biosynthesis
MRVAIVHDWLTVYAGAEKALEQILTIFPKADLFSVIDYFPAHLRKHLLGKHSKTTFIQHLPLARKLYRIYLPLMPLAIEQLNVTQYDLVITSSHAVAKGVITAPGQPHICYCYSPLRYAWDLQHHYVGDKKRWLTRYMLHKLRLWDFRSAQGVDVFMAISQFIAKRIEKCYRRQAEVVYPPVDIDTFPLQSEKSHFYVTASRLVRYKRVDLIIEAFRSMPGHHLIVIGSGPEEKELRKKAPSNVTFTGYLPSEKMAEYLGKARAFVYAAVEDFGILPLEAQACGTPVIAFGQGGVKETCSQTAIFFDEQTPEKIREAILSFESEERIIHPNRCRENAERFSVEQFREGFLTVLGNYL